MTLIHDIGVADSPGFGLGIILSRRGVGIFLCLWKAGYFIGWQGKDVKKRSRYGR